MNTETVVSEKLEALGFTAAAARIKELKDKKRKLAIAYEHFRYVRKSKMDQFQQVLAEKSHNWDNNGGYHTVSFSPVAQYQEAPPMEVLVKMEEAQALNCFDSFEVAHIKKVKDPILFGRVKGCSDRFFVGQWDEDLKIEDILKPNEG